MRDRLVCTGFGVLYWQWWNYHDQTWNNHVLSVTVAGFNNYVSDMPPAWEVVECPS